MSDSLIALHGDKRDNASPVRAKAVYEDCFIRSLDCCDKFMDGVQISLVLVSDNHWADLSFPPVADIRHSLLVIPTVRKADGVKASCFVKASGALICLETPQFECADPAGLCCID